MLTEACNGSTKMSQNRCTSITYLQKKNNINAPNRTKIRKGKTAYLISRLTDICAFKYIFPRYIPNTAINTPGAKKIGEKNTVPASLTIIEMEKETTLESMRTSQPSMLAMSCVERVMILDVGVSSSQLKECGLNFFGFSEKRKKFIPERSTQNRIHKLCIDRTRSPQRPKDIKDIDSAIYHIRDN